MAVTLLRDQALTVPLLSTYGRATLLGRDGRGVQVPLVPLLAASSLVKAIVNSSQLHPGIYGPLTLSFEIAVDILAHVGEVLGTGESNLRGGNIEDVKHVLDILGVKANLSQTRVNNEYYEENIKLEEVFKSTSDEDTESCIAGANEDKGDSYGQCYVNDGNLEAFPDPKYRTNKRASKEDEQKCNICEYSAISASDLNVHERNHSNSNRSYIEKPNSHRTVDKKYTCIICKKSFSKRSNLHAHSRIHTGEKPFTCEICASSFAEQSNLNKHRRIHTGEKPFTCEICATSFAEQSTLSKHRRVHTDEKPHTCGICKKSFSRKSDLRPHSRIHSGEKPFTCKICLSSFAQHSDLHKHRRIHTGEKPFKCKVCGYATADGSALKKHTMIHTGERPHKCTICDYSCIKKGQLKVHMMKHT